MNVLFWNIGKRFINKSSLLIDVLEEIKPDILCIAEGTYSIEECGEICDLVNKLNYNSYYSPIIGKKLFAFPYYRNGLKLFYNNTINLASDFGFEHIRNNGRIIKMELNYKGESYIFIFLHNYSKSGNREVTDEQRLFISDINAMFKLSKIAINNENVIVVGDYNLEPWDNILRMPGYFESYFLKKHYEIAIRKCQKKYYNPITEKIINSNIQNLGGTFYSENSGWALYDYPLYDEDKIQLNYKIITQTTQNELLKSDDKIFKDFLINDIDHLPILLEL